MNIVKRAHRQSIEGGEGGLHSLWATAHQKILNNPYELLCYIPFFYLAPKKECILHSGPLKA